MVFELNMRGEEILVTRRLDGSWIKLNLIKFGSGRPSIFLGASIHGDELTALAALWELKGYLEMVEVKGSVTMLMGMNPEGISYGYRNEPYFNMDLNRIYPGSSESIYPYRLVNHIYRIAYGHDLAIDIHASGYSIPYIIIDRVDGDIGEKVSRYAGSMGLTIVEDYHEDEYNNRGLNRCLRASLIRENIPGITLELPGGSRIDWRGAKVGFKALLNLLGFMGMVDAEHSEIDEYPVYRDKGLRRMDVICNYPGILEEYVEPGEKVSRYMPLGIVRSLKGDVVERLISPSDGYILMIRDRSIIYPSDIVFIIASRA